MILKECFIKELQNFQNDLYSYESARKKCIETGNSAPLTEFVLKKAIEAKNILKKMFAPYNIKNEDIKVSNADSVIDAIYQDKFNYIDGSLKGDI